MPYLIGSCINIWYFYAGAERDKRELHERLEELSDQLRDGEREKRSTVEELQKAQRAQIESEAEKKVRHSNPD